MSINTDYAQYKALGEHDRTVEDMKLGLPQKPLDKAINDVFKPVIIETKDDKNH